MNFLLCTVKEISVISIVKEISVIFKLTFERINNIDNTNSISKIA